MESLAKMMGHTTTRETQKYAKVTAQMVHEDFGRVAQLFENENKLLDHIISNPDCRKYDWASNMHLTQQVTDLLEGCFDYLTTNEDRVIKRTNHYLTVLEYLDKCLTDIEITTDISLTTHDQHHREPSTEAVQLPQELDTAEARRYFARAVEAGLMSEQFKWLKSQVLLACFAHNMSLKLELNKAVNSDGSSRISWRPFEVLFGLKKYTLRGSFNEIQKTGQEPRGIETVNTIFQD